MSLSVPGSRRPIHLDDLVFHTGRGLVILVLLISIVIPILFAISVSFRHPSEFFAEGVHLIPKQVTLDAWETAIGNLGGPIFNSIVISIGVMVIALLATITGAYAFARLDFPGKPKLFLLIVIVLLFPGVLLVPPIADLWADFGMYNTVPGLWLALQAGIVPFATWILRDFFSKLPANLEEAAQVYGCTQFSAFVRVILPLATPALIAIGFLSFFLAWNNFLLTNMLTTSQGPQPAVVYLYQTTRGSERMYWGRIMAETLVIATPPVILYLWARRYLNQAFDVA